MEQINETSAQQADKFMFKTYSRFPLTLVKGEGCRVWDEEGKAYLDFVGGIAVCSLGHSSPIVTKVLEEQSQRLVHVSNLYYTKPQIELARLLVENSFAQRVFFCNSGAEANEAAIKLARKWGKENLGPEHYVIVCMENSFHGRTMATLSATGQEKVRHGFEPLLPGFKFVPFNDLGALESAINEKVCAVMLEPIQGEGGVVVPDADYLKNVRNLCDDKGIALIFDEIQVGMGRTGKLFAYEHFGISPDIMTLAKALGNGLPVGAMLATEKMAGSFGPGTHATTFGGTPLVTAVSAAVLRALIEDNVIEKCRDTGQYFKERLMELKQRFDFIKDVRGVGLILGMELDIPGAPIVNACMERGYLINCTQDKVLRFLPPLIIEKEEIDELIVCLVDIFEELTASGQG